MSETTKPERTCATCAYWDKSVPGQQSASCRIRSAVSFPFRYDHDWCGEHATNAEAERIRLQRVYPLEEVARDGPSQAIFINPDKWPPPPSDFSPSARKPADPSDR